MEEEKKDKKEGDDGQSLTKIAAILVLMSSFMMLAMGICVIIFGYSRYSE